MLLPMLAYALLIFAAVQGKPLITKILSGATVGLPTGTTALATNTYDYIVVGAGTAGLTVASRLSEGGSTVLVVEAGIDIDLNVFNSELSATPGGDVIGAGSSASDLLQARIDWSFYTVPQRGANNRRVRYARGKCTGGSSARNFMIYQRPSVGSMQKWQELTADDSWGFHERLDDFKKSMTFSPPLHKLRQEWPPAQFDPSDFNADASVATSPLFISYPNTPQNFSKYMQLSANELGVETVRSFNGGSLLGVQYGSATISPARGRRSTSRSFYTAARGRRNFKAVFQTYAKKILFTVTKEGRKRATGVVISTTPGGRISSSVVYARKEVIISAGAFQSPQLLMVSGIGPKAQLDKFGITPIIAISENVGRNMQDHVFFGPTYPVEPATRTFTDLAADPIFLATQLVNFTVNQLGPLTNNVADLLAWEKVGRDEIGPSPLEAYPADWPVLEALSAPGVVGDFSNLLVQNAAAGATGSRFATILFALVAPLSRGQVTLASADTADLPIIDPSWLTDPVDQRVALYAFKRARQYFATHAMQPILKGAEYLPGPAVQSDVDILNWIRNNLMTVWHASCTCSMRTKQNGGVLDNRLRVYDVDALRVVDASSFPMLPPGHPQSVVYMLAERAATLIQEDNA